ncbi:hypothetical protein JTE90_026880 [Oedothorax gibbosus]|uniref:Uncharacterized protein n=1 Tax=Oedothorax gibbosus TaxID=931172 RepID=A0AAV6TSH5_9ARAC|nr:hypothetical protein JTE90_026880 [Oedothorax gibbosus]
MAVQRELLDLFPDNLSNGIFNISRIQDWDPRVSLNEWLELEPKAFVTYIPPGEARVFFISAPVKEAHFTRLLTSARSPATLLPDPVIGFDKVGARLLKDPSNARRKSSVRTIYMCNNNLFIVSKWFTFGLLRVEEGEQHVYTSNAPIKVFHMPSSAPLPGMRPPNLQQRAFCPRDFSYFTEYVMRPGTTYTVPPITRYLVVTVKKCYFTVGKLASDVLVEGSIPFNSHRTHEDPIYTIPLLSPRSPGPEDRLQRSAAKRTRRRSPERDLPGCSSWSSPREIHEPRPDTVTGTERDLPGCSSWSSPREIHEPRPDTVTGTERDLPGCSSWPSSIEMNEPRPDTVTGTTAEDGLYQELMQDLASCDILSDFLLETYSVPFATTPGGSSAAHPAITPQASSAITPQASAGITPQASPDPPRHLTDTSSRCIVAHLPAPRLWRRTQQPGTVAQAHAIVFQHRTYLWEDDDAPGMGPTLRAAMSSEAPVLALDLSHMDVPMDLSRPQRLEEEDAV